MTNKTEKSDVVETRLMKHREKDGTTMNVLTGMYLKVQHLRQGQTMTEYALILAAIAVVVFATYEVMGQDIGSLVNKVNSALLTSS